MKKLTRKQMEELDEIERNDIDPYRTMALNAGLWDDVEAAEYVIKLRHGEVTGQARQREFEIRRNGSQSV
jgi:hypothetical protein